MDVAELYKRDVKPLPASERLRLAKLILDDIPPQTLIDYSTDWTQEDISDFDRSTWAGAPLSTQEPQDDQPG